MGGLGNSISDWQAFKEDIMEKPSGRQERRLECVDLFLAKIGVTRCQLAASTQHWLEEWARQEQLVMNQPSANHGSALIQLCKAVESEMQSRLGKILQPQINLNVSLGETAHNLKTVKLSASVKQQLSATGIKPGFVSSTLPNKLRALAKLRKETGAAHGGTQIPCSTDRDLHEAGNLFLN